MRLLNRATSHVVLPVILVFIGACGSGSTNVSTSLPVAAEPELTKKAVTTFTPDLVPTVYRFAKISTGAYFYTGSEVEVQTILNAYPDFRYEGPAFERDTSGQGQPVYRFANTANGGYFYTGSAAERDQVLALYPNMRFEGSTFSVAPPAQADANPVFRLANLNNGAYLYTLSAAEKNYAISLGMWRFEGTSFQAPKGSPLLSRAWSAASLLETDDNQVSDYTTSIDDTGKATTLFLKSNGSRLALFATRSQTSVAGSVTWSTPRTIDTNSLAGVLPVSEIGYRNWYFALTSAPNGNVIATWITLAACTANTYSTSGNCKYLVTANYTVATDSWSAAQIVADTPENTFDTAINSAGDVVITNFGWVRAATYPYYTSYNRVSWRPSSQLAFQSRLFSDVPITAYGNTTLDNAGNMMFTVAGTQAGTTDIISYRGNMTSGFSGPTTLDGRSSAATFVAAKTTSTGKSVVLYKQSNGTVSDTLFAAESISPTDPWTVTDLGSSGSGTYELFASDDGIFRIQNYSQCRYISNRLGNWAGLDMAADACANYNSGVRYSNRNGDFVKVLTGPISRWVSYDAKRNKAIQSFIPSNTAGASAGYVLGFLPTSNTWNGITGALSVNGTAVLISDAAYDTLPTPSAPLGDGRGSSYRNLFGFILR
jgi:hypothetical protein